VYGCHFYYKRVYILKMYVVMTQWDKVFSEIKIDEMIMHFCKSPVHIVWYTVLVCIIVNTTYLVLMQ